MSKHRMPDDPADHTTDHPPQEDATRPRWQNGYDSTAGSMEPVPSGWLAFSGLMLLLVGFFNLIEGLAVLFRPDHIGIAGGRVMILDFTTWGWVLVLVGFILIAASVGVLNGKAWARGVGIAFALFSALVHLSLLTIVPFWSILAIAIDILVIYGLTTPMQRVESV